MHVRRLTATLAALAGIAPCAPALADDDDLWVGAAAFVCLEQDAGYKATPLGEALGRSPAYQHWREGEGDAVLACIAKKALLPAPLCSGIFRMDPKGDPATAKKLYAQYADAIRGLERIGECEGAH
jgi:hypothetical protein